MNDEIKEILQMLEAMASNDDIAFLPKQASLLLDYITDLQQLCDKYEEEHNTTFKEWQKDIQANKKAIEYIKENAYCGLIEEDYVVAGKVLQDDEIDCLLNILEEQDEYNK